MNTRRLFSLAGLVFSAHVAQAALTTNSWTNSGSGKWELAGNWSLGAIPGLFGQSVVAITNANAKTVTIDAATTVATNAFGFTTIISNLLVQGVGTGTNMLFLNNANVGLSPATALAISNNCTISSSGALVLTNSTIIVRSALRMNGDMLVRAGGTVLATNSTSSSAIGFGGIGNATLLSNGLWRAIEPFVGESAGTGTLTINGGMLETVGSGIDLGFTVASGVDSTGTIWITDGTLLATNSASTLGFRRGSLIQSNGTVRVLSIYIGRVQGPGNLTVVGGSFQATSFMEIGSQNGTGSVFVTGGTLVATNQTTNIGGIGVGQLTASNGMWFATDVAVAANAGAAGTLTVAGGTNSIYSSLTIGTSDCTATGRVIVAGGKLFVTNSTGTAVLDVRSGTLELDSGTLNIDKLVMTNPCGHFVFSGFGSFNYNSAVLDPTLDQDGDGIPTGWEQQYGFNPLDPRDASLDPDGDGMNNLTEYQAGTDPTSASSTPFVLTSVQRAGNDLILTWKTGGGTTNQVQVNTGSNFSTNGFTNLGAQIIVLGSGLVTTNYTDIGGATNSPVRYYRVRLVP